MPKIWRIIDIVKWAEEYFSQNKFDNPRLEIEWLLRSILKCNKLDIYLRFEEPLNKKQLSILKDWVKRRINDNEPLQYITESCEFYGRPYILNSKVLIPRQETERLVDIAIEKIKTLEFPRIIDIGTGSGCIASTLAIELPNSKVHGIDISLDAIQVAEKNKARLSLNNIYFQIMDILNDMPSNSYDVLISNPPYISYSEMSSLAKEIKNFEPHVALTDFRDGLTFYNRLVKIGKEILNPNGWIILEVGLDDHPNKVHAIFKNSNYKKVELIKDFNGDDRVLIAQS